MAGNHLTKIIIVVGTRPNFIKITKFREVLKAYTHKFELTIIHTGQHAEDKMSGIFFQQ